MTSLCPPSYIIQYLCSRGIRRESALAANAAAGFLAATRLGSTIGWPELVSCSQQQVEHVSRLLGTFSTWVICIYI